MSDCGHVRFPACGLVSEELANRIHDEPRFATDLLLALVGVAKAHGVGREECMLAAAHVWDSVTVLSGAAS